MPIKIGDRVPDGTLTEFIEQETPGCTVGPNAFQVSDLTKGKKIVVFGLPGAFTPTCSAKHVPSYVANIEKLKGKGLGPRDLGLPAARACMLKGDADAAIAWLTTIPTRFLPPDVQTDAVFAPLRTREDFRALFSSR